MFRNKTKSLSRLLVCLLLAGCESPPQLVEQRILQFGTVIDISLIHHDVKKIESKLADIEQQLAVYRHYWHAWEDSDLFRFNQALAQGESAEIPESLRELIGLSQTYYDQSQGLFNPAIGKLVAAYGFHGEAEADQGLIAKIQTRLPTMRDLKIKGNLARSDNPMLQLDLGGIAKGYAIGLIADDLKKSGFEHFLINIGGDLLAFGERFGEPWRIGVQNPFAPGAIASLSLSGHQHLFTSGNYQRYYQSESGILHHIIDPRSGKPSAQISSASVLADNAVLADVAATTLMIDGWKNHRALAASLGIQAYLIVDENLNMIVSRTMADKIKFTENARYNIVD